MSKSIFDPKAARYFANVLERESEALQMDSGRISTLAMELATTWQDKKYDAFFKVFDDATKQIAQFIEHSERYRIYLQKKAGIIEQDYFRH